jgi:EAL domain-containing protein (putative c-di-GMP-specific phosphodiesterase class I)
MKEKLTTDFEKKIDINYQPIVKIVSKDMNSIVSKIISLESLAQPKRDILLAKKIQFIQDQDKSFEFFSYMLENVLNDSAEIIEKSKNKNISVSVNVDPSDIIKNEFSELISDLLSDKKVKSDFLTIEVLESFLNKKDKKTFVKNLKKIKKL